MKERFKDKPITIGKLGKYPNLKELIEKAKTKYRRDVRGKSVQHKCIGKIDFNRAGIEETITMSKGNPDVLKATTKIRKIIKYGKNIGSKPVYKERKDMATAFEAIEKNVKYKGKKITAMALVRNLPRGLKDFYALYLKDKKNRE
jgi:hypothetical protein